MKFAVNSTKFQNVIRPIIEVATRNFIKGSTTAFKTTIKADKKTLSSIANGGRLALSRILENQTMPNNVDYKLEEDGETTVDVNQLNTTLSSFKTNTIVIFDANDAELKISSKDDIEVFQTIQVFKDVIDIPKLAQSFEKEVKINRQMFINGISRVAFAVGFSEDKEEYMHYVVRFDNKFARFLAGSGARFAVCDITGDNFVFINKKTDFLIHKRQMEVIVSILKELDTENIIIKQARKTKDIADQIVIEFGDEKLILVGINTDVKYINEGKLLDADRPIQILTNIDDWIYATRGMEATYTDEYKKTHTIFNATLDLSLANNVLVLKTDTPLKSSRKITINKIIQNKNNDNKLSIECPGPFLTEIGNHGEKEQTVQIEVRDDKSPIVVRHLVKDNPSNGTSESFLTFFASLKKD